MAQGVGAAVVSEGSDVLKTCRHQVERQKINLPGRTCPVRCFYETTGGAKKRKEKKKSLCGGGKDRRR